FVKIERKVEARQRELPMFDSVMEKIGRAVVFNICMLGALLGLTQLVRMESILSILSERIPADLVQINRQALQLGLELAQVAKPVAR
ncbi:MAG: 2-oxoacid:acceptor oxidoreductase family protein, partial [Desulfobacterales bacterium]|nr:2-oxoacid:acceptor oxidoreductase family protein [Desulfobacterales bacterium]